MKNPKEREFAPRIIENEKTIQTKQRTFNPEMLTLAREAEGLTQKQLALKINATQSKISKFEDGLIPNITTEDLESLSEVLHVPVSFFTQEGKARAASASSYRKKSTIPMKVLNRIDAEMNKRRLQLEKLMAASELETKSIPHFDPDELNGGAREAAILLRQYWSIPKGPIDNLTEVIEDAGIPVIHLDFGTKKLDGLTFWSQYNFPIIFLNPSFSPARMRMTAAHELGHIIMHRLPNPDMEPQAMDFGGEFMMPSQECRHTYFPTDLAKLLSMKLHWKVSMQAILYHGKRIGVINERYARFLWMQMGKSGYRKIEPHEDLIPIERPTFSDELIELHLNELDYSKGELSESLAMLPQDFENTYLGNPMGLKVI